VNDAPSWKTRALRADALQSRDRLQSDRRAGEEGHEEDHEHHAEAHHDSADARDDVADLPENGAEVLAPQNPDDHVVADAAREDGEVDQPRPGGRPPPRDHTAQNAHGKYGGHQILGGKRE
jgi:hypothetical protein